MSGAGDRTTVVVANADQTVCEVLARVIEAAGHEAVRVTDAAQVSGAVLSAPAEAVVVDLGGDTADQLRALRSGGSSRGSEVRAIVISTGPANARLAWEAGADAVLTRPFEAEELHRALADAMARGDGERAAARAEQLARLA